MTTETTAPRPEPKARKIVYNNASAPVYGLGLIGAWVYYLSTATSFWMGVLGILKGIVWPAMLVYEALKYLNM
ncbi:MAG: hypothetical protein ACOYZ8_09895 [Chloroflexota bacterium]